MAVTCSIGPWKKGAPTEHRTLGGRLQSLATCHPLPALFNISPGSKPHPPLKQWRRLTLSIFNQNIDLRAERPRLIKSILTDYDPLCHYYKMAASLSFQFPNRFFSSFCCI